MNKKTLVTLLQVAVTVGLLAWLFRDGKQNREMLTALSSANLLWIAAAFGVYGIVVLAAVTRWKVLLSVQGIHIAWTRLASLFLIGLLFNPFLPGGTGGDVAKIFYLLKETPDKKPAALLAVLMDRLMGLFGLILIAGVVMAVRWQWLIQPAGSMRWLVMIGMIFGGSLAFIVTSIAVTGLGLVHKLPERMPLRDKLVDLSVAYNLYGRSWRKSLLALALCVPVHLGSFSLFYCVGQAFKESAPLGSLMDYWGIMPIVGTIAALPISIGGTGPREMAFMDLLGGLCGITPSMAKLISLTGYFVLILWSMAGGIAYLFYRPTEHARLGKMNEEVTELEHQIAQSEEEAEKV